ncbi:MAG: hypothetical protein H0U97_18005 [Gammaproteobacteria bacterium]|nr:hypothetical protein [Gammaproteobacteria bacterium]
MAAGGAQPVGPQRRAVRRAAPSHRARFIGTGQAVKERPARSSTCSPRGASLRAVLAELPRVLVPDAGQAWPVDSLPFGTAKGRRAVRQGGVYRPFGGRLSQVRSG